MVSRPLPSSSSPASEAKAGTGGGDLLSGVHRGFPVLHRWLVFAAAPSEAILLWRGPGPKERGWGGMSYSGEQAPVSAWGLSFAALLGMVPQRVLGRVPVALGGRRPGGDPGGFATIGDHDASCLRDGVLPYCWPSSTTAARSYRLKLSKQIGVTVITLRGSPSSRQEAAPHQGTIPSG